MFSLLKSAITHRIAGGFVAGAVGILALQPPEGAAPVLQAVKAVVGIA